jgi:hypothetical protein
MPKRMLRAEEHGPRVSVALLVHGLRGGLGQVGVDDPGRNVLTSKVWVLDRLLSEFECV